MSDPLTTDGRVAMEWAKREGQYLTFYGARIAALAREIDRLTAERLPESRERHGMIQVYSGAERPLDPVVRGGIAPDGTCVATGTNEPRPPEPAEIAEIRERIDKASEVVAELCKGSRRWTMSGREAISAYDAQTRELADMERQRDQAIEWAKDESAGWQEAVDMHNACQQFATRELASLRALRARLDDDELAERIGCEHDTEDRCGCHNGGSVGIDAYRRAVREGTT